MRLLAIAPCLALLGAASAASVPRAVYGRSVTTLSVADLNALAPYTEFARDRGERMARYRRRHGSGCLWYEPPLSGEVEGAQGNSSDGCVVVQGGAQGGAQKGTVL